MTGEQTISASAILADQAIDSLLVDFATVSEDTVSIPLAYGSSARSAAFEAWISQLADTRFGYLFGQTYTLQNYQSTTNPNESLFQPYLVSFEDGLVRVLNNSVDIDSTNTQVEGVDEADLIETDGEFIYILSGKDLIIVKSGLGDELQVMSRTRLAERPVGMYLAGDRLALVSSTSVPTNTGSNRSLTVDSWWGNYWKQTSTVTILDVEDRTAPSVVQKTELDGQLVATRVVDGQLRMVVQQSVLQNLPALNAKKISSKMVEAEEAPSVPSLFNWDIDRVVTTNGIVGDYRGDWYYPFGGDYEEVTYQYETKDEYLSRLRVEMFPQWRVLDAAGKVVSSDFLFQIDQLDLTRTGTPEFLTSVVTFDLQGDERGPVDSSGVMTSYAPLVYANEESLFLFAQGPSEAQNWSWNETTNIWKFEFSEAGKIQLAAQGKVDGRLLNQFSADEKDGYLRIVVSEGASHGVTVLQQVGNQLEVVGSVSNIAIGEQLYSVRFMGDKAFFVTFRQTDPLFAVDLSDPTNPQIVGELVIPGVSDYLQPLSERYLLGIGRDADPLTGLFGELQVSLFDISLLSDPKLLDKYLFLGGRSTTTSITGNRWMRGDGDHLALGYFSEEQVIAIPVSSEQVWNEYSQSFENGLQLFQIDEINGLEAIGLIQHDSEITRSLQIGDHLYAISSSHLTVHSFENPAEELASLTLIDPTNLILEASLGWPELSLARSRSVESYLSAFAAGEFQLDSGTPLLKASFDYAKEEAFSEITDDHSDLQSRLIDILARDESGIEAQASPSKKANSQTEIRFTVASEGLGNELRTNVHSSLGR